MTYKKWFTIGSCILFIQFFSFASTSSPQKSLALKDIYQTGKIEFVPVLKITRESVPPNIPFKSMFSICRLHNRLYVLDPLCNNIKVFTADGQFLKTFGKEGSRESELSFPSRMNVIDGQLVVWEDTTRRFSIFNPEGAFKHTLQPIKKGNVENFDTLGNGNLVIERHGIGTIGDDIYQMVLIELYTKNFQLIKVLYQKQISNYRLFKSPEKRVLFIPFQAEVLWHILRGNNGNNTNKLVIGCSDAYSIDIIDTETGISRAFTHPYSPVKVEEADRNRYFNSIIHRDEEGKVNEPGADRFMRDNTTFPAYKPVFKQIITDYDGNILVFTYTDSDNGKAPLTANEFDAFDANGQFIDHVKIVHDAEIFVKLFFSAKDRIFWVHRIELGTPGVLTKYSVN
jgi:hypothetical protein